MLFMPHFLKRKWLFSYYSDRETPRYLSHDLLHTLGQRYLAHSKITSNDGHFVGLGWPEAGADQVLGVKGMDAG